MHPAGKFLSRSPLSEVKDTQASSRRQANLCFLNTHPDNTDKRGGSDSENIRLLVTVNI